MKKLLHLFTLTLCISQASNAQNLNVTLADQLKYPGQVLANLWGWKSPKDGKEYALVGAQNGMSIVDVSNPSNIFEVVQIPGPSCEWREIRTNDNYAYITSECGSLGLQIVDLSNLPATNLTTTTWTPVINGTTLKTIHALQIDEGRIYLYGSNVGNKGAIIADIKTNPMIPGYLGSYDVKYVHDGYVRNHILYAGEIYDGLVAIVDVNNPATPKLLASFATPGKFTHNTWLSGDSKTLFTTDEVNNSYLAAYNISDLSNIKLSDKIQSNPGSSSVVHNTYIINKNGIDYAVTSWYKDGITIVNASDPTHLVQVGNYDTSPMSGSGYDGCWGVYPFLPSGLILASDIQEGLFVLNPNYVTGIQELGLLSTHVSVNPNPFVESTVLTIDKAGLNAQVLNLFDIYGRQVKTLFPEPGTKRFVLERENLPSGIYMYQAVENNLVIATGKLCAE